MFRISCSCETRDVFRFFTSGWTTFPSVGLIFLFSFDALSLEGTFFLPKTVVLFPPDAVARLTTGDCVRLKVIAVGLVWIRLITAGFATAGSTTAEPTVRGSVRVCSATAGLTTVGLIVLGFAEVGLVATGLTQAG
ncbi:hypothetical protein AOQ84DRAFT_88939 [Glonium stellatum]|uniref:Uncharacterized protein n=1 Tax=Glonium stellatum TaxID=574774 RepID=A0A8E2FAR5_9PEZI|nr:hypothetical protein AOQ84DRAFT_88939 [Glonium stellatum]